VNCIGAHDERTHEWIAFGREHAILDILTHMQSRTLHADEIVALAPERFVTRPTNALEKAVPSLLNAIIAFGIATPTLIYFGPTLEWKIAVVVAFALYESFVFFHEKDRCFGMKIMDTYWRARYETKRHVLYNLLYTLSFATLLVFVWFPLDLLLINIFLIQLPCVVLTGTTLHGWLSGMETVKVVEKK
jgi:hypothetical protein